MGCGLVYTLCFKEIKLHGSDDEISAQKTNYIIENKDQFNKVHESKWRKRKYICKHRN